MNAAVLIIYSWLSVQSASQQAVTIDVSSMAVCESMAAQAREKLDIRGRYVEAVCLEVKQ